MSDKITITNEQAVIIGRNIGEAIVDSLRTWAQQSNSEPATKMPLDYVIDRFAKKMGEAMRPNSSS